MMGRLGLGVAVGLLGAAVLVFVLNRFLLTDDMEAAVAVLVAVLCFGVAEVVLSEAGLFATVTLGVVAANQRIVPTARINGFGETLEVLIIGTLFILLGALVELDLVLDNLGLICVLVAILVLVVRPVAVAVSQFGTSLGLRDRALAAWMDPRGIVAAATAAQFAPLLAAAGLDSSLLSPIVFGVILGTGFVYGLTALPVARLLGVTSPKPTGVVFLGTRSWLLDLARCLEDLGVDVLVLSAARSDQIAERHDSLRVVSVLESDDELDEQLSAVGLAEAVVATEHAAGVSLVVAELVEHLGRSHVYVIPRQQEGTVQRLLDESWTPQPFMADVTLAELDDLVGSGASIQVCPGRSPRRVPSRWPRSGPTDPSTSSPASGADPTEGTLVALVGGATPSAG